MNFEDKVAIRDWQHSDNVVNLPTEDYPHRNSVYDPAGILRGWGNILLTICGWITVAALTVIMIYGIIKW